MKKITKKEIVENLTKKEIENGLKISTSLTNFLENLFNKNNLSNKVSSIHINILKSKLSIFDINLNKFTHLGKQSPIWLISSKDFKEAVKVSNSVKELLSLFQLTTATSSETLKKRFKVEGLSFEEFIKLNSKKRIPKRLNNSKLFVKNSKTSRNVVRKRILKENLIIYECAICKIKPFWNGKPMTLILDHINGVNNDHRLENLRFVCANCDIQLPTYGNKNKKKKSLTQEKIKNEIIIKKEINLNNKKLIKRNLKKCSCGKILSNKNKTNLCIKCMNKNKKQLPPNNELLSLVKVNGYEKVGRMFNFSGAAIKKRLKKAGMINSSKKHTYLKEKINILKCYYFNNSNNIKNIEEIIYYIRKSFSENKLSTHDIILLNYLNKGILNPMFNEKKEWFYMYKLYREFVYKEKRKPKITNKKNKMELKLANWLHYNKYHKDCHKVFWKQNKLIELELFINKHIKTSTPRPPREKRDL